MLLKKIVHELHCGTQIELLKRTEKMEKAFGSKTTL
jgi:hypothetical protein